MAAAPRITSKASAGRSSAAWLGLLIAYSGLAVLVGWGWDIAWLKSIIPGFISMKPNTALGFVLIGVALMARAEGRKGRLRHLACACAVTLIFLGLVTALEFAIHRDLGIDQLLFAVASGDAHTIVPGRMSPITTLEFMLLGMSLLLSENARSIATAQRAAMLVGTLALLPLSGLAYGSSLSSGLGNYVQMALHTSALFMLACAAVFRLHPEKGIMQHVTPATLGGWVMRRMVLFVVAVPLLLGWLHEFADRRGLYDDPLGDALLMLTVMLLQVGILWWTAGTITRLDIHQRQTAEDLRAALAQRQEREDQFHAVVYASQDAIQLIEGNTFIDCNEATLRMFGCQTKQDFIGISPSRISPPVQPDGRASGEKADEMMALAFQKGFHRFEWTHRRADGTNFPADVCLTAMVVGGRTQLYAVVHDVTELKQREEMLHRLSQAVQQTPAAVVITDTRGAIEYVNSAFSELTGYSAAEALGQNPRILQSGMTSRETYQKMWEELRAGRTWRGELLNKDKAGKLFWELAVISPLRDSDGKTTHYLAVKENITIRKAVEQELLANRRKLAQAMALSLLANWEYDVATDDFIFNDRFFELYGTSAAREGGYRMASAEYARIFVHPNDAHLVADEIGRALSTTEPHLECQLEHRVLRRDGNLRRMLVRYTSERGPDGHIARFYGTSQDITEFKEIEEALRAKTALFDAQVNASIDGILVVDGNNRRVIANRRMGEIFNVPWKIQSDVDDTPLLRHNLGQMKEPQAFLQKVQFLNEHPQESSRDELELNNGTTLDRYSAPVRGADGHYYGRIWAFRDITAQKQMEADLRAAASIDKLTGLPNRALLCDRIRQAIFRAQRLKDYHFAVLFLDMDRFKLINDSLGHNIGDLMLQEIGRRLNAAIRIGDSLFEAGAQPTTARLGGDEFVILLDALKDPDDAARVARRMLEVLAEPYRLREHDIYSTASIGIVTSDLAAESPEQILRDADTAMYEAKLAGKGRYAVFGAPMRQRVQNRLNLETDLRKAIDTDQFFLVYEPIVSLITGEIERFEALVRWRHPTRGVVMPGEFIPIAEETGLILPLGEWVLRTACTQLARWKNASGPHAPRSLSVNLSRTQLLLSDLPLRVGSILRETGIDPGCLHLEVTESAVMRDAPSAIRTLHAIKALGVKLDIDDFGTGYSSLACLHDFPMDVLKIDPSFIANIERGRDFAALVHAVSQLARNLNIQVVGEGIETEDQALILQSHDCEFGQGYFFSRPMTAEAAGRFRVDSTHWGAKRAPIDVPAALPVIAPGP